MSKRNVKRFGLPVVIVLSSLVLLVILVAAFYVIHFEIPNRQAKHRISEAYAQIKLPAYLHATGQQWTDGGFDNAAEWQYSYRSDQPTAAVYSDVTQALSRAGYTITEAHRPGSGVQIIRAGANLASGLGDQSASPSISATKKNLFVHFDFSGNSVEANTYESHNTEDKK